MNTGSPKTVTFLAPKCEPSGVRHLSDSYVVIGRHRQLSHIPLMPEDLKCHCYNIDFLFKINLGIKRLQVFINRQAIHAIVLYCP